MSDGSIMFLKHAQFVGLTKSAICDDSTSGCAEIARSRWSVVPPRSIEEVSPQKQWRLPTPLLGVIHFSFVFVWFVFIGIPSPDQRSWYVVPFVEVMIACVV